MTKEIALINNYTTTGGRIISGDQREVAHGYAVALLGDKTTCPKCKSIGTIIEGAINWLVDGKPVVYDGCIVACGCKPIGCNRVIASKSYLFVGVTSDHYLPYASSLSSKESTHYTNGSQINQHSNITKNKISYLHNITTNEKNLIRADAHHLLQCVDELCEKHLYHNDIKQAFKQNLKAFANNIVEQVDNNTISYQQGSEKIKEEEKDLWDQSFEWVTRGLSILGGTGLLMAGAAMCTTGIGCVVGAYLGAHGINSIQEGVFGEDGFLKSAYQEAAKQLGMSKSVGSFIYDMVDIGISVKGKLKLVPKIGELGEPVKKLWYYGRQDLVRYYRQMGKWALASEIFSDMVSLKSIIEDFKNIFVYDKDTKQSSLSISEPEKITNVGNLVDSCVIVHVLTFDENEEAPGHYYRCISPNGEQYEIK